MCLWIVREVLKLYKLYFKIDDTDKKCSPFVQEGKRVVRHGMAYGGSACATQFRVNSYEIKNLWNIIFLPFMKYSFPSKFSRFVSYTLSDV